jgi:N-acetylglucosaminyl-diphospho-decaprenol L-rhamnosyltransferase
MALSTPDGLTVLVVTHNSAEHVARLAQSWRTLGPCRHPGWSRPSLVVADCASTDATASAVRQWLPEARWLPLENVGYGAAANQGAAGAADWLLLCNADLEFTPAFLQTLEQAVMPAEGPRPSFPSQVAAIAPQLLNADSTVQPSVGRFPMLLAMAGDQCRPRWRRKYIWPQPPVAGPVDWATGACLLLRSEALRAVGGFDPLFFMYMEELDLQYRLHQAGWMTWFLPQARVIHRDPSAQRPRQLPAQRWAARGSLRYFAKHGGPIQLAAYRLMALATGRLPLSEALASRTSILKHPTGPEVA